MSDGGIIIAQIIASIIQYAILLGKARGMTDEQLNKAIIDAMVKVRESKPEDLPDV